VTRVVVWPETYHNIVVVGAYLGAMRLEPVPTHDAFMTWYLDEATRPATDWPIGHYTAPRRARDARLSKLWTPERSLAMFRRPVDSGSQRPRHGCWRGRYANKAKYALTA